MTSGNTINVRAEPSANAMIRGIAYLGRVYDYLGETSAEDWHTITFAGEPAWISGKYTTLGNAPCDVVEQSPEPPAPSPDLPAGRIYDVSTYDGNIDFAKVVALTGTQRCEMMIIRAQGKSLDDKLARNIKYCKQYGIPYGVYAYSYAGTEAQGKAEADSFYERVIAAGGEPLCWVIDAEEGKNTKASTEAMRK